MWRLVWNRIWMNLGRKIVFRPKPQLHLINDKPDTRKGTRGCAIKEHCAMTQNMMLWMWYECCVACYFTMVLLVMFHYRLFYFRFDRHMHRMAFFFFFNVLLTINELNSIQPNSMSKPEVLLLVLTCGRYLSKTWYTHFFLVTMKSSSSAAVANLTQNLHSWIESLTSYHKRLTFFL